MPGVLRTTFLLTALVAAIAPTACGGGETESRSERNGYVRELNAAQQEFATNASTVSQDGKAASLRQYRRTLKRFEKTIAEFAAKLRRIDVPRVVREEHQQLIAAVTSFGSDFEQITDVLNNPNARALSEAQAAITTATQRANARIEAAAAAIDSKLADT